MDAEAKRRRTFAEIFAKLIPGWAPEAARQGANKQRARRRTKWLGWVGLSGAGSKRAVEQGSKGMYEKKAKSSKCGYCGRRFLFSQDILRKVLTPRGEKWICFNCRQPYLRHVALQKKTRPHL